MHGVMDTGIHKKRGTKNEIKQINIPKLKQRFLPFGLTMILYLNTTGKKQLHQEFLEN